MVLASHSTRACYLLACFCALAWHNRRAVHDWLESGSTLGESNNSSRAARKIKMHISYEGTAGTVSPPVHIRHIPHVGGKFALVCFRQPIGLAQLYHVCVMSSSALVLFFLPASQAGVCLPDSAWCASEQRLAAYVPCHQLH